MMNEHDALKCNGSYVRPNNDWKTKQSCNPSIKCLALGLWPAVPASHSSCSHLNSWIRSGKKIHWIMEVLRLSQSQGSARSPERPNTWARTKKLTALKWMDWKKSNTKSHVFLVGPCHSSNVCQSFIIKTTNKGFLHNLWKAHHSPSNCQAAGVSKSSVAKSNSLAPHIVEISRSPSSLRL